MCKDGRDFPRCGVTDAGKGSWLEGGVLWRGGEAIGTIWGRREESDEFEWQDNTREADGDRGQRVYNRPKSRELS